MWSLKDFIADQPTNRDTPSDRDTDTRWMQNEHLFNEVIKKEQTFSGFFFAADGIKLGNWDKKYVGVLINVLMDASFSLRTSDVESTKEPTWVFFCFVGWLAGS